VQHWHGSFPFPPPSHTGPVTCPPLFLHPLFHTGPVKHPLYFNWPFGPPPSSMGHGQVARISRVWGIVPYSPVFPLLHPVTTPSHWALHMPTLPSCPPLLQPGPAIAQTLSQCHMYGCMSPPWPPFPIIYGLYATVYGLTCPLHGHICKH
jgi:hypothetical protein